MHARACIEGMPRAVREPPLPQAGGCKPSGCTCRETKRRAPVPCRLLITMVMCRMAIAQSRLTAQGQISVPAEVRKKLGVGPGSVLEWDEQNDQVVVRRAGRYTSKDVHGVLFPEEGSKKNPADVKDAIRKYIRKRHARG